MSDLELSRRYKYSDKLIQQLRKLISSKDEITKPDGLCIYTTGSIGRGEASQNSDLDIFFVKTGKSSDNSNRLKPLEKAKIFSATDTVRSAMKLPSLTEQFLEIHYLEDITSSIGSPDEDAKNIFTARMLMLLEGKYLFNEMIYTEALNRIIDEYFRDYHDNKDDFIPLFLLNDIVRFWKTLCLNYEKSRNMGHERKSGKRFKLKYSRLLTCFSMIAPLITERPGAVSKEDVLELAGLRPWDRLAQAATISDGGMQLLESLKQEYDWFLKQTEDPDRLNRRLEQKATKDRMFDRANKFNKMMYDFLKATSNSEDMIRYIAL